MHHLFAMYLQVSVTQPIQSIQNSLDSPSVGLEEFWSMIALNYLSTMGIQALKISKVSWLNWVNKNTPWVTRSLVAVSSALTAVGIHKTWEPSNGTLIITGLTLAAILHAMKHIVVNYAMQHGWWKILYANREGTLTEDEKMPVGAKGA